MKATRSAIALGAVYLAFALTGCASQEQQRERMAANAEASCRAIGLDQANEKWTDCMIEMMAAEKRSDAAPVFSSPAILPSHTLSLQNLR